MQATLYSKWRASEASEALLFTATGQFLLLDRAQTYSVLHSGKLDANITGTKLSFLPRLETSFYRAEMTFSLGSRVVLSARV